MATRRLELVFTGDTSALERSFRRVDKASGAVVGSTGKITKGLGRVTAASAVAGAALVGAFAGKSVKAASDLGEQVSKTGVVFRGASKDVIAFSETTASSIGISQRAALEATGTFGNMLVPMGVARERAGEMSTRMVTLAGDMASFNNASPEETLDALRAGLAGEAEPLRRFGVFLDAARVQQEALNLGLAKSGEPLTSAAKAQATYSLILKDSKDAQGDFGRTLGESLPNQARVAKAQFEELSATAGQVFVPVAAKALTVANEFVAGIRDKWPQIKPTVENVMNAVGTAVRAVAGWIQRNWPEIRETTVRVFRAVRAAIESAVEWIRANLVPTIRSVVANARRFWDRFGDDVIQVFNLVRRQIQRALVVIRSVIEVALAVLRGDWSAAWRGLRTIVATAFEGIVDILRTLGPVLLRAAVALAKRIVTGIGNGLAGVAGAIRGGIMKGVRGLGNLAGAMLEAGKELGRKIIDGIVEAIRSSPGAIKDALSGLMPDPGGGVPFVDGIATGGWVGGKWTGRDNVFARLATGEAVLNPRQQSMIPGGKATLDSIFRATGGRMGGTSFAAGGIVGAAAQRASSNVGEPYGKPSRGESRTGPSSWDCSGYATYVANVNVGGTTASAYTASTSVRDHSKYPIVWGFRKQHSGGYRGGYDEHMGVRVGGVWYQTSGGRTAQTGSDGDWQEIRVPRGLESLTGADGDGGPLGESARGRPQLTPLQRIGKIIQASGLGNAKSPLGGRLGRSILAARGDVVTGVSDSLAGGSLTERESSAQTGAGRAARTKARKAGKSPDEVQAAGEEAERAAEAKFLKQHIRKIDTARRKLRKRKGLLLAAKAKLRTAKPTKPGGRKAAAKEIQKSIDVISRELSELLGLRAEAVEALANLNEQAEGEAYDEGYVDPGEAPTEAELAAAAAAEAALTPGLDDDLAAAKRAEQVAQAEYDAAVASGDPIRRGNAASALLSARQAREQVEATIANTEAVNANTEQLKQSFGGSVAFTSRGQDWVIGAAPSSDRLESATLGV